MTKMLMAFDCRKLVLANINQELIYSDQGIVIALPIDTHCHRIPNRIGWVNTKTPEKTEFALRRLMPKKYWNDFNNMFVTFGQNICLPRNPKCHACPIFDYCGFGPAYLKGRQRNKSSEVI